MPDLPTAAKTDGDRMPRKSAAEKRAETRAKLLDAATATFRDRGYHAASMDEISERAGYSYGAIYSNFKGKEALFLACIAHRAESVTRVWDDFIASARELGAEPENFGKALVSVLPDQQWTKAILEFRVAAISDDSRQSLLDAQRHWHRIVRRLLEVYCATHGFTPRVSLDAVAASLAATVDGLRVHALVDPDIEIGEIFSTTLGLLLAPAPAGEDPA
jgi:AcrR family transcriptional regulator